MPNERIPRAEYYARVRKTRLQGLVTKVLHILARNMPFSGLRVGLYKRMGIKMGQSVRIGLDTYVDDLFAMAMRFDNECRLEARVATVVHDGGGGDPLGPGAFFKGREMVGHVAEISIGRGAIIGSRAVILPGVIIGETAIVRPGAVVSKDVPPQAVVAGNPARTIGSWRPGDRPLPSLLPAHYTPCEEYDRHTRRHGLRSIYRRLLLGLARFTLSARWRVALYRAMGIAIGKQARIDLDVYVDEQYPELITIEDGAGISARATLVTHAEIFDASGSRVGFVAPIRVKQEAHIGSGAVVCPGVTIGHSAIVGPGAVITDDVPDGATVLGNPARVIYPPLHQPPH